MRRALYLVRWLLICALIYLVQMLLRETITIDPLRLLIAGAIVVASPVLAVIAYAGVRDLLDFWTGRGNHRHTGGARGDHPHCNTHGSDLSGSMKHVAASTQDIVRFPHLQNLMGGYFHQDYDLMGDDDEAILNDFASTHKPDDIDAVIAEIDDLLAMPHDELLVRFETEVSAYDMRIGDDDDEAHAWLVEARRILIDRRA